MNQMNMNQGNMMNSQMMIQMMNMLQNSQNNPMNQMAQMMQNNFGNNNIDQNNTQNQQNQQNNGFININFRAGAGESKGIEIQCTMDEKVSDVIQRYRAKTGDRELTKKFIFNAKMLNQHLSVDRKSVV